MISLYSILGLGLQKVSFIRFNYFLIAELYYLMKGWVPKPNIRGFDKKIYILDFFGSKNLRGTGLNIPPERFLTAFGATTNTFLGYYMSNSTINQLINLKQTKLKRGVIWGKNTKHFEGKESMIRTIAETSSLVSTATNKVFNHQNIEWLGHQTSNKWLEILGNSKFLLGLGNPLLGPSAIDAISLGCMYINPIYRKPMTIKDNSYISQHDYAMNQFNQNNEINDNNNNLYVCSYHENNTDELLKCINLAMKSDLKLFIPNDFIQENYYKRVAKIFQLLI